MSKLIVFSSLLSVLWANVVFGQHDQNHPSRFFGKWYLVKVDWADNDQARSRKEIGTINGEFLDELFNKNWDLISSLIEKRRYWLSVQAGSPQDCAAGNPFDHHTQRIRVGFRTSCNGCGGCAVFHGDTIVADQAAYACTEVGCDFDYLIWLNPSPQRPLILSNDTLILTYPYTERNYYLVRGVPLTLSAPSHPSNCGTWR